MPRRSRPRRQIETLHANAHTRSIDSQLYRLRANAAAAAGDESAAAEAFGIALANARNLGYRYWLAPVLVDYGHWLTATNRPDEGAPLLAEARALLEHMGATARIAEWTESRSPRPPPSADRPRRRRRTFVGHAIRPQPERWPGMAAPPCQPCTAARFRPLRSSGSLAGRAPASPAAVLVIVAWIVSYLFGLSDTWQLVVTIATTPRHVPDGFVIQNT